MMFREVVTGNVRNRNIIVPESDLSSIRKQCQERREEMYISLYGYDEEILEHMKLRKSVRGFAGKYYLKRILFDIDKHTDTDSRLFDRVKNFLLHLTEYWEIPKEIIEVWYSGRGFHVQIPDIFNFKPDNNLPKVASATLMRNFTDIDDLYANATRIVRVANTINTKTMRYKIRINQYDLDDIEGVLNAAKTNTNLFIKGADADVTVPKFTHLVQETPVPMLKSRQGFDISTEAVTAQANAWVTCMQKLWGEGSKEGQRHDSILRLASAFRRGGIPQDGVTILLQSWCPTLEPYEVAQRVADVFKRGLQYGCKDVMMTRYCDPKCYFYKNRNYLLEAKNATDMEKEFQAFARSGFRTKSFDIGTIFQTGQQYEVIPGELVIVFGDVGVGKSTFVQNLCLGIPHLRVLYNSLENDQHLTFRRFVQIATGLTKEEVYKQYERGTAEQYSRLFQNVRVITTSPDLKSIGRLIQDNEADVVVVDTTDMIQVETHSPVEKIGMIATGLKEYAQQYKCIIIGVHHISKDAAKNAEAFGLGIHSGKGDSAIEQKADKVIGIEREGDLHSVTALKSRDENKWESLFRFDHTTFRFTREVQEEGGLSTVSISEDGWVQ